MRRTAAVFLGVGLFALAVVQVRADDRDALVRLLDQAIQVDGGADRLARSQVMVRNARGIFFFFGKEVHFTTQLTLDLPDRLRDVIEVQQDNQKNRITHVVTRDHAWRAAAGTTLEMTKPEAEELREEMYVLWLTTLLPLKDPAFRLGLLPESKRDGRPLTGLSVARPGHAEVKLYFDKQSGRLVKIERQAREVGLVVPKEYLLSDPKEFEGITRATKQVELTGGKKSTELLVTSFIFPGKVEESVFGKP